MASQPREQSPTSRADLTVESLLEPEPAPFALLHRPEATGAEHLELLTGTVSTVDRVGDLPLRATTSPAGTAGHDLVVLLPYRQLSERGFRCHDDREPILAVSVAAQALLTRAEVVDGLPALGMELARGGFDLDDAQYAEIVDRVLQEEIGSGAGANFVIHRTFTAEVTGRPLSAALALFRTLLLGERGAYWTFVVHTGDRTFVGATPERHVSLSDGTAVMNPISGTFRYPESGPAISDVLSFLADQKEADELFMVLDEELKMMARVCDGDVRVIGPRLKEMGHLAHTEYLLEGQSSRDARAILRETMFAPTVTGSPLENATRVIARHEPTGRSYYSGVVGVIGHDGSGHTTLDSSILIRTAEVRHDGAFRMGVGATLVRGSDPISEVAETRAKAASLLSAVTFSQADDRREAARTAAQCAPSSPTTPPERSRNTGAPLGDHPQVRDALADRNTALSRYWLADGTGHERPDPALRCVRGLLIDAEDTFTSMLGHHFAALGAEMLIRGHSEVGTRDLDGFDLVVLGPGPGDPRVVDDPKIAKLRTLAASLLAGSVPFLAVCLGHQVVSSLLGLPLTPLPWPNQGTQQRIDLFGAHELVGFYNTFVARCHSDTFHSRELPGAIEVSRDRQSGNVHGLRAPGFASLQFHPESILSRNGHHVLGDVIAELTARRRVNTLVAP